jgi:hypothetical protein
MLLRFARLALAAVLLAAWQAALQHEVEHADPSHEAGLLCGALDALTACAAPAQPGFAAPASDYESPTYPPRAPRLAEAPPFLSQGPPAPV